MNCLHPKYQKRTHNPLVQIRIHFNNSIHISTALARILTNISQIITFEAHVLCSREMCFCIPRRRNLDLHRAGHLQQVATLMLIVVQNCQDWLQNQLRPVPMSLCHGQAVSHFGTGSFSVVDMTSHYPAKLRPNETSWP